MLLLLSATYLRDLYRGHYGICYWTSIALTIRSLDRALGISIKIYYRLP